MPSPPTRAGVNCTARHLVRVRTCQVASSHSAGAYACQRFRCPNLEVAMHLCTTHLLTAPLTESLQPYWRVADGGSRGKVQLSTHSLKRWQRELLEGVSSRLPTVSPLL